MGKRAEQAIAFHGQGYNCSQSVACAFCDLIDMSEDDMFKVMEGFGAGMGGMHGTCGAISGAVAIAGMLNSKGNSQVKSKVDTYQMSKKIVAKFEEKNSSSICGDLKGIQTKKVLRSCEGCIQDAAEILEELLGLEE